MGLLNMKNMKTKRTLALFMLTAIIVSLFALPVSAAELGTEIIEQETIYYDDGSYLIITLEIDNNAKSGMGLMRAGVSGTKRATYYDSYGLAWVLNVHGSFTYNGSTSSCTSASSSVEIYRAGWSCTSHYATRSGATATAYGTFKNGLVTKKPVVSLYCSPSGVLS